MPYIRCCHQILFFVNWWHDVGFIDVIGQSKGRILMTILSTSYNVQHLCFFPFLFFISYAPIRTSIWYSFGDIKNIPSFFTEKTRMEIMYHMSSSSLESGWRRKSTEIPMNWSHFCSKHRPQTRGNFTTFSPVYNFHFKICIYQRLIGEW